MRKMVWGLLLLFAFAIPWEYSLDMGDPWGNIARLTGLLLLMAAVPAILHRGRIRTPGPLQWLALAFFLWFSCSYFWTIDLPATLSRMRGLFQEMITVWLVWEFAETPRDLRALLRAYIAGSWVLAGLTLASLAAPEAAGQMRFVAEGQDPNDVARYLDLGFPMAVLLFSVEPRLPWKLLAAVYLPLGVVCVLLTASRSGFLAALVALAGCGVLMLRSHPRVWVAGLFASPLLAGALWVGLPHETLRRIATIPEQLQGGDLNQRLNIWQAGWEAFVRAPFFGTGAGSFVSAARLAPLDTAHNTALAILVEGGLCALILAAAIVAVCAHGVMRTHGPVRIALGTTFLVWVISSSVATVEQNRTTWLLLAMISFAGRLAVEDSQALCECFAARTTADSAFARETV